MASLTINKITESGLNPTYVSADAGGDTFTNDDADHRFIHVVNDSAGSITVTCDPVTSTKEVSGFGELTKTSISVTVPAGESRYIGPFPYKAFKNPDIQYSAVTSVTIAALEV